MKFPLSLARARTVAGILSAAACLGGAQAALVVTGDSSGTPGSTVTLHIGLDAPLVAEFDQFELTLSFDPAALDAVSAARGTLPPDAGFAANPGTGIALISFSSTLNAYPPGEIATWTFSILPGAPRSEPTLVSAKLVPSIVDGSSTRPLQSNTFAVTVVPEPESALLLLAGLGVLGAFSRPRAQRRLRPGA